MIRVSAVRFFLTITPAPPYITLALVLAVVLGGWMLWMNPADIDSALGSVLLLQMCAMSNGYVALARRGWLDPLLVSGCAPRRIALANVVSAALPAACGWLALAVWQAVLLGSWPTAISAHRVAAFAVVTAVAWTAGLNAPRATAAVLWIGVLVALASLRTLLPTLASLQRPAPGGGEVLTNALACVVCPFLLLGDAPAVRDPRVIALVVVTGLGCGAAGVTWSARREWPLGVAS